MSYPKWILTDRKNLCTKCHSFVDRAWLLFIEPALYTESVCESCADELTAESDRAILPEVVNEEEQL